MAVIKADVRGRVSECAVWSRMILWCRYVSFEWVDVSRKDVESLSKAGACGDRRATSK